MGSNQRRKVRAIEMQSIFTKDTTAVVVSLDGSEWPEGVFVFSNYNDAEEWMKWKIRELGGNQSHLSVDEFQSKLAPHEMFYVMELHDRRK